tara:strand:- start:483 stop:899 length:417 start_codon:yes stop_codon:yes gene_type:complete
MKKDKVISGTIQACETKTIKHNADVAKYNAKQDLIDYFNANGVIVTGGKVVKALPFVKAYMDDAAKAYVATGNITAARAMRRVRDFVVAYCGYRDRLPRKGVEKGKNAGVRCSVIFSKDKTIVVIDGVTYAKVKVKVK